MVQSPVWGHFHALLVNSMPQQYPMGVNVTEAMLVRELGRLEGWREVLNFIGDLTRPEPDKTPMDDFGIRLNPVENDDYGPR